MVLTLAVLELQIASQEKRSVGAATWRVNSAHNSIRRCIKDKIGKISRVVPFFGKSSKAYCDAAELQNDIVFFERVTLVISSHESAISQQLLVLFS